MRNVLISIILLIGITACENKEQIFPDYDLQTVYFPLQLPIRSLSLGEDRIENSLDREYKFDIGVSIGGMYENTQDWTVDYVVDPSLTDSVFTIFGSNPIIPLPTNYYTLSPLNTVTIPSGFFNGLIRVELTDQFFNDPLSLTGQYVIPLRLTDTSADSILSGVQALPGDADRRIAGDWKSGMEPKDWVLYGIKYVNAYHGTYLHRGRDIVTNGGAPVETVVFSERNVEDDLLMKLTTTGIQSVSTNGVATKVDRKGKYSMTLEFGNSQGGSGSITIKPTPGSSYAVTGSGEYFDLASSSESWTGLTFQSMYLQYSYNDGTNDHQVVDTLIFRDRGIVWEENLIKIVSN